MKSTSHMRLPNMRHSHSLSTLNILHLLSQILILLKRGLGPDRVLHGVRHNLVPKELVKLL